MRKRNKDDLSIVELLDKKLDKVYFFSLMTVQIATMAFIFSHNMRLERKIDVLLSVNEEARKICDELNITSLPIEDNHKEEEPDQYYPRLVAVINKNGDWHVDDI